jgi:hypothetical protein
MVVVQHSRGTPHKLAGAAFTGGSARGEACLDRGISACWRRTPWLASGLGSHRQQHGPPNPMRSSGGGGGAIYAASQHTENPMVTPHHAVAIESGSLTVHSSSSGECYAPISKHSRFKAGGVHQSSIADEAEEFRTRQPPLDKHIASTALFSAGLFFSVSQCVGLGFGVCVSAAYLFK